MKRAIFVLGILILTASAVFSQTIWKMTYDVAIPSSYTKEFTDHFSWRGVSLDGDRMLDENLGIGFGFSWQVFVEKEIDAQLIRDQALITGTQVRYINSIPMMARFSYYQEMDMIIPYFTAGVGTVWQEQKTHIGTWAVTSTGWQFAIAPEVGVMIPAGPTNLIVKVKYNHGFETKSIESLSYLNFGLGIAW